MRRIIALFLFALLPSAAALSDSGSVQEEYIRRYSKVAVSEMYRSGVPASITLAQGLLESGAGKSRLATEGNNHFGIKCHNWSGKRLYHDDDRRGECFRKYASASESFRDHSDFLRYRDRYAFLFELEPTDYKAWAYGLKKAGYATDPHYPAKLIKLIEDYRLYEYDTKPSSYSGSAGAPSARPESPLKIAAPKPLGSEGKEVFSFNLSRELYSLNGVPFVRSSEGETYASIAKDYRLFFREILRFNDLTEDSPGVSRPLPPGTAVYLQPKKSSAAKGLDKHVWEDGDSLWAVSQRYAVKLSKLKKMNGVSSDSELVAGDLIKLRK